MQVTASIIIRTYNEARHLGGLLQGIARQYQNGFDHEVIVVDSGSTDETLDIARKEGARIVSIPKEEFSFGRSLNVGCEAAQGDTLVFISGHCVPASDRWLHELVQPIYDGRVSLAYGRQLPGNENKFSEGQLFLKFYPEDSQLPQDGFFCNNANAAIGKAIWTDYRFDEELTGLEDMELGQRLVEDGMKIGYVAEAPVYHHHSETWRQIKGRYEREAIALRKIMPEVTISVGDFVRYFASGVLLDASKAIQDRCFWSNSRELLLFRLLQFWGSYRGNHHHKRLTREEKERYFYPS